MAASTEGSGGKKPSVRGNAMDALTPPTMKVPPPSGGEQTLVNPPSLGLPTQQVSVSARNTTTRNPAAGTASNLDGITLSVTVQDLNSERLLQSASRIEAHGRQCPTLKGIPLLAKLGQGGMGAVYYGVHPRLRSEVAVKVLPFHLAEQDPQMIRRFYREAQIAAQVRSPYLVNVTDVDEECGLFFLVMEYVNGNTAGSVLKSTLKNPKPGLPELDVLEICIAATEGLNAAHTNGVVHRDIKPDNIMIPFQSRSNQTYDLSRSKLMDLGLARSEEGGGGQSLTGVQTAMGTPGYMAPEQALDAKTADKRSDVFSMGATLYALLVGTHPFPRDATMKVLMATMHEPHEPVSAKRSDVSEALSEVINKCLEKKQENRYADAQQLSRALKNARKLLLNKTQIGGAVRDEEDEPPTVVYSANKGDKTDQSSQATLAGSVKPLTMTDAAPRKKGMLYVAAGGVMVALIGGGVVMSRNWVKPPDSGSGANGTGTGTNGAGTGTNAVVNTEDPVYKDHLEAFRDAVESAEEKKVSSSVNGAKTWLSRAQKYKDIKDAALLARASAIEKWVLSEENKEKYVAKMKSADFDDQEGKYDEALKSVNEILKEGLASSDKERDAAKAKKIVLENEIEAREMKKQASDLKPEQVDKKLELVNSVLKNFPSDVEALDMKKQCDLIIKDRTDKEQYFKLIKQVSELEAKEKYQDATTLALQAKELYPKLPDADAAVKRLGSKLDNAQKDAIRKIQTEQFNQALSQAGELLKASKFQDADTAVKKALGINPADATALALQAQVDKGLEDLRKSEQAQAARKSFNDLLSNAKLQLDADVDVDRALERARKNLADARAYFPDDPMIKNVEVMIAEKQEKQRIKQRYDGLVEKANSAFDDGKLDEASTYLTQALEVIPKGEQALRVQRLVETKRKKINEENKNKEDQFNKMLADGDGYEKAGDAKPEWSSERVAQYETALGVYRRAKEMKMPGGVAEKSEESIQKKLTASKAAYAAKRADFDARIKSADALSDSGDFDGALSALTSLKTGFDDKTVTDKELAYQAAKASAEKDIQSSMEKIRSYLSTRRLTEALQEAKKAKSRYPSRKELSIITGSMNAIQLFRSRVDDKKAEATAKLKDLDRTLYGRGSDIKRQVYADLDTIDGIGLKAIDQFITTGFKNSDDLKQLETEKSAIASRIDTSLADLTRIAATPLPPPPETRPERNQERPTQSTPKSTRQPVGEVDPFNQ